MVLIRLLFPEMIVSPVFGKRQLFARRATSALLALSSAGGAVTETSNAGPSLESTIPRIRSCAAPGLIRILIDTPPRASAKGPDRGLRPSGATGDLNGGDLEKAGKSLVC